MSISQKQISRFQEIVKLRDENKLSFMYIGKIMGFSKQRAYEIYSNRLIRKHLDLEPHEIKVFKFKTKRKRKYTTSVYHKKMLDCQEKTKPFTPTLRDFANECDFSSASVAHYHLRKMVLSGKAIKKNGKYFILPENK